MSKHIVQHGLPLYQKVIEDLKYKIIQKEFGVNEQIMTEEELCEVYGVSRITIRRALKELEVQGFLKRYPGKGTFVSDWTRASNTEHYTLVKGLTTEMKDLGKKAKTSHLDFRLLKADIYHAALLDVEVGVEIVELRRVRELDGVLFAYSINYFPFKEGMSTDASDYYGSLYEYFESLGLFFNYDQEYLEAVNAGEEVAKILDIETKDAVLKRVKRCKNNELQFSEYSESFYIGSMYRYHIELR